MTQPSLRERSKTEHRITFSSTRPLIVWLVLACAMLAFEIYHPSLPSWLEGLATVNTPKGPWLYWSASALFVTVLYITILYVTAITRILPTLRHPRASPITIGALAWMPLSAAIISIVFATLFTLRGGSIVNPLFAIVLTFTIFVALDRFIHRYSSNDALSRDFFLALLFVDIPFLVVFISLFVYASLLQDTGTGEAHAFLHGAIACQLLAANTATALIFSRPVTNDLDGADIDPLIS